MILSGCFSSEDESGLIHQNTHGGFYYRSESGKKLEEGYVYVSKAGDTVEMGGMIPEHVYPGLYKNLMCYVFEHSLVCVSPTNDKRDTILLHDKFLTTSNFFEYDTLLVVMDINKFDIVDMRNKQLMMVSDMRVGNVTISGKNVYVIADVNDYSEEPEYWILKGNVHNGKLKKVKRFPEFPIANPDCTTEGWNGMLVSHGVLFVKGQQSLFAFDAKTGRKLDKIAEDVSLRVTKNNASQVVFEFEDDTYTFSFATKRFE